MTANRRILNATPTLFNSIEFKSKFEESVYKKLLSLGYDPKYEVEERIIWEGFSPNKPFYIDGIPQTTKNGKTKKFQDWKYTPDFKLELGDYIFYIEAKGMPNDIWPYKRKLFIKSIDSNPNAYFFEVHTIKGLLKSINEIKLIYEGNSCTNN